MVVHTQEAAVVVREQRACRGVGFKGGAASSHRLRGIGHRAMQSGGETGDDGGAEQYTVFLLRQKNAATGGIGVQWHQQRAAGMTTSQTQRVDAITMAIECINDVEDRASVVI
jgi:hypothetical protein